jgi:hypothetical protein
MYETRKLEAKLTAEYSTWKMFLKSIDYLKPPERAAHDLLNSGILCTMWLYKKWLPVK